MICGNSANDESFFRYRSSSYLSEFFDDCGTNYRHDGATRNHWVAETLRQILAEPYERISHTAAYLSADGRPPYFTLATCFAA